MSRVALIGAASQELHVKRRDQIRPDLNTQFRQLCSPQVPVTSFLFGDDLPKTIKDISETNRVGVKVVNVGPPNARGHSTFNPRGRPFLGRRRPLSSPQGRFQHRGLSKYPKRPSVFRQSEKKQ